MLAVFLCICIIIIVSILLNFCASTTANSKKVGRKNKERIQIKCILNTLPAARDGDMYIYRNRNLITCTTNNIDAILYIIIEITS